MSDRPRDFSLEDIIGDEPIPSNEAANRLDIRAESAGEIDEWRGTFTEWLERKGQRLEPGQLVLAKVLFDRIDPVDLSGEEKRVALEMFGCEQISESARRLGILIAVCGGRGGKSLLAAWRLVYLAATIELTLSPGEQAFAIIVAPDQRLAEQVLRYAIGIAEVWFPEPNRVVEKSSVGFTLIRAKSGPLPNRWTDDRVRFRILPASKGGAAQRGRALVGAVLDEAAFFRGEDSAVNDRAVIEAITPRVMPGGEVIITTTPWARAGEVYSLFDRNFGHAVDAVVAHAPTWALRTDERILAQIEREKNRGEETGDMVNYFREFGAQFLSKNTEQFFEDQNIEACTW